MRIFDIIQGILNPQVESLYKDIEKSHKEALQRWVDAQSVGTLSENFAVHPTFKDKKYIGNHLDCILKYEKIIKEENASKNRRDLVISAASKYPLAFKALILNLSMSGIPFTSKPLPGERKSKWEKRQTDESEQTKKVFTDDTSNAHYRNVFVVSGNSSYKSINTLSQIEYDTLYKYIFTLSSEEEKIKEKLKEEDYLLTFEDEILDNERRLKYYESFLSERHIECNNYKFIVNHIAELDLFISDKIDSQYKMLCNEYPLGTIEFKKYRCYDESDIDFKERLINNAEDVKRLESAKKKYIELKNKYPLGLPAFESYYSYDDGKNSAELSFEEVIECESEIAIFEQKASIIQFYTNWVKDQEQFASYCRELHDEIVNDWGCYNYGLSISCPSYSNGSKKFNYRIWQHFCESYCSDPTLDYSLTPLQKNNNDDVHQLKNMSIQYKDCIYDEVIDFIINIKKKYGDVLVLFGDSNIDEENFNLYHFQYLKNRLSEESIFFGNKDINKHVSVLYKYIVVVEVISQNEHMLQECNEITTQFKEQSPHIAFISLMKEFSRQEMLSIIENEYKKVERKKIEEQTRIEKQRREEERLRREKEMKEQEYKELVRCVSEWEKPSRSTIKCFSLYNYYPTTCDWDADEDEWEIRNLIWDFKASPIKFQPQIEIRLRHENTLKRINPDIETCLKYYFRDKISKLTLVCIPSSKLVVTQRRYEDFSRILCEKLGMTNAYNHVRVTKDGEAKRLGGTIKAEYALDEEFFNGRYILLFDDVITSGASMERFNVLLQKAGAKVVAGLSLGKTRHVRQDINPIDMIIQRTSVRKSTNDDDLPF